MILNLLLERLLLDEHGNGEILFVRRRFWVDWLRLSAISLETAKQRQRFFRFKKNGYLPKKEVAKSPADWVANEEFRFLTTRE